MDLRRIEGAYWEFRIENYGLRMLNYECRITDYELRMFNFDSPFGQRVKLEYKS